MVDARRAKPSIHLPGKAFWSSVAIVLAVLGSIALGYALALRNIDISVAAPRPAPTPIQVPSPYPVVPPICKDMVAAAKLMHDRGLELDDATTKSSALYLEGVQKDSLSKLNEAKRMNAEARRLNRAVEKARSDFSDKARACEKA